MNDITSIEIGAINPTYKICNFKRSVDCITIGPKDQFNKGRCCEACWSIVNKEFYSKHQAKYRQRASDNKKRKAIRILMEENNIEI